jgi:4-diphosphocytidyl-2-C-methyl-D-erythritol kinase
MTQISARSPRGPSSVDASPALVREQARAKVNLTLHVKGKRPDGYHELESLVVFANLCDELSFSPASADSLSIEGPFASAVDGENLVLKAKRAVAGWLDAEIYGEFLLRKNIPVAAGLGGGSSDAAAAIRALLRTYRDTCDAALFIARAAAIGADVPVCLYHRAAWMGGIGERVTPAPNVTALPAILVNPRLKLSTASVFKELNARPYVPDGASEDAPASIAWPNAEAAAVLLRQGRNDLEAPAMALEPNVKKVLDMLRQLEGCLLARLSGSGPTCFGLFASQETAAKAAVDIAHARPGWWVVATTLS